MKFRECCRSVGRDHPLIAMAILIVSGVALFLVLRAALELLSRFNLI